MPNSVLKNTQNISAPTVSIILPLYNTERFIGHCIESLLSQTFTDFELLILNDGSTDNSLSIANEYAKKDGRIKVFTWENRGASATRNRGLDLAKGEYICFVDSDDYVAPYFLKTLLDNHLSTSADISIVSDVRVSEKQNLKFRADNLSAKKQVYNRVDALKRLFTGKKFGLGQCNKMFKRTFFDGAEKIRFNEKIFYSEDVPFLYQIFMRADKVIHTDKVCYAYTKRNGSQVRSKISQKKTTSLIGIKECADNAFTACKPAYPYVSGWQVLVNFEILFYMIRDSYYSYQIFNDIKAILKGKMKCLTRSKGFPLYRRILLPLASFLAIRVYKIKYRKRLKKDKKNPEKN